MKKHITSTLAVAAAALLAAASCSEMNETEPSAPGLTIALESGDMQTRADDLQFETAIEHFDFFFFSDAEGNSPISGMHGRADGASKTLQTGKGQTYEPLRKITSYVYILANYPARIDHSKNWTLPELLALEVDSPILTEKKTEINNITGKAEENGEVSFAGSLVMDSFNEDDGAYTTALTPEDIEQAKTVTVRLTRLASKLTLDIKVESSVPGSTVSGYGQETWTPVLKDLQAYYVNALNNRSTVQGTPVRRADLDSEDGYSYMTYPTLYPLSPGSDSYTFTTAPIYTYPQEWEEGDNGEPYFKVAMPWLSDVRGTSNFYYKIVVPKPEDGKWTIGRNRWYKIAITLSVIDTDNEYVEITDYTYTVAPWAESGWTGGNGLSAARFFSVPTKTFELYSDETLAIPYSSSSTVSAYFTEIKFNYYGSTNGNTYIYSYTQEDNVSSVSLPNEDSSGATLPTAARDANAYSLSVDNKFVNFSHALNKVYTVREITLVIKNTSGDSETITILQHPAIEIKKRETKNTFVNGRFGRAHEDVCDADGNLIGVKYDHTTEYYDKGQYRYHSTTYWSGTVISGGDYVQNGMGTIYGDGTSNVGADHFFMTEVTVSAFNESNNTYNIAKTSTAKKFSTDNYDSATKETKEYRIGDPRVAAGSVYSSTQFALPNYLYSDKTHRDADTGEAITTDSEGNDLTDVTKAWEEPLKILIASGKGDDQNVIAPKFLISSAMNVTGGVSPLLNARRRAATYQENGYPAGRWRLPTQAEIAFIVARQREGVLPHLFANTYYWCADGNTVYVESGSSSKYPYFTPKVQNTYIRMVYDLWYWGDDPVDFEGNALSPSFYHANMHEH